MGVLEGKVAIVTGATSGIGKRIAEIFVQEGASVVIAARRAEEGKQVQEQIGDQARFIKTDVSNAADVKAMIEYAMDCFGRLDCLVNNAGLPSPMVSILDTDETNFDQVMGVNVRGVMLGMKMAIPHMLKSDGGSVINVSSASAFRTGFSGHTYSASKAAVTQLTRSVAGEMGARGIRVNSISPGAIVTGIFAKNAGVEGKEADRVLDVVSETFSKLQPSPRAGTTDDVANAAVFLASDLAFFINGHDLVVDGGITLAGFKWEDGVGLRAGMVRKIQEALGKSTS